MYNEEKKRKNKKIALQLHLINIGTYCVLGSATCASRPEGPPDILISQSHVFCKHIVIHNDLKHRSSISPHMPPAPPPYLLPVRFETVDR